MDFCSPLNIAVYQNNKSTKHTCLHTYHLCTIRTLLLALGLLAAGLRLSSTASPGPYHPFCRSVWLVSHNAHNEKSKCINCQVSTPSRLFAMPCAEVNTSLVQQIQAFSPKTGCNICNYKLVSVTPQYILANHTSPDGLTEEKLSFKFNPSTLSSGCRVSAQSQSLGFASLLDDGLNYCNLYNLLSASGLNSQPNFMEMTNEWACLGLATCKVSAVKP